MRRLSEKTTEAKIEKSWKRTLVRRKDGKDSEIRRRENARAS